MDGPWNIGQKRAEEYGWDAAEAAKAMRRIDPKIELVAVGSSGTQLDTYLEWDRVVLERVYDSCDYISLHRYMGMPAIDELSTYDRRDTRVIIWNWHRGWSGIYRMLLRHAIM